MRRSNGPRLEHNLCADCMRGDMVTKRMQQEIWNRILEGHRHRAMHGRSPAMLSFEREMARILGSFLRLTERSSVG
jgi:hypothetical protein